MVLPYPRVVGFIIVYYTMVLGYASPWTLGSTCQVRGHCAGA